MKIKEIQQYAKDNDCFDSLEFTFTNLNGEKKKLKWLDAYFGLFKFEERDGFITVNQWIEHTGDVFDLKPLKQ